MITLTYWCCRHVSSALLWPKKLLTSGLMPSLRAIPNITAGLMNLKNSMADVAVTILATDPTDFADRIQRVKAFAKRVHVDISDGRFAPTKTIGLAQAYGVTGAQFDLHLMIEYPETQMDNALALKPD